MNEPLRMVAMMTAPPGYSALTVLMNRNGNEPTVDDVLRSQVLTFEFYAGSMSRPRTANPMADMLQHYVIEQPDGSVLLHTFGVEGSAVIFKDVLTWFEHFMIGYRRKLEDIPTEGSA